MALPSIWYGTQAFISIQKKGGSAVSYSAKIQSFDVGGGDRGTEEILLFGNNSILKQLRAEQLEVSISALTTDTKYRYMWAGGTEDTTESTTGGILVSGLATTRDFYRIILLLKDATEPADLAVGVAGPCLRYTFTDSYAVTVNESLAADGNFEVDLTFKCTGSSLATESASSTTYNLSTLATYT